MHSIFLPLRSSIRRFVLSVAFVFAFVPAVLAQDSVISGKVISSDGQPVSGAHVRIVDLSRHTDVAADGTFKFDGVPQGSYLIEAKSPRFGTRVVRVMTQASAPPVVEIVMSVAGHEEAIVVSAGIDASSVAES
ncbi:MAG: carboxypeptidase-like regulatory domain-containing protein, partial [Vicinamibacteria bacterium]